MTDHNPRSDEKEYFEPADTVHYGEHSANERTNAHLKDEFGGHHIMVKGHDKVMCHRMLGLFALSADQ